MPSTFSFLGIRNETAGSVHNVHTPRFVMDESQMPLGMRNVTAHAKRIEIVHRIHETQPCIRARSACCSSFYVALQSCPISVAGVYHGQVTGPGEMHFDPDGWNWW